MFATEKQEKILKSVSQHATPVGPRQSSVNLLDIEDAKPTHHKTATTKSCSNIMADIKSASSESFTREEAGTPKDDTDQDQKRESQNEQNESGFVDASKQTETINSQKDDSKHQETNESQQPADNSREDEKNIPDHKETDDLSEMEVKSKEKSEVDDPGSTDNFEKPGSDGSLASSTGYTASVEYCSDQEQHSDHSCSAASSSYAELCRAVSSKSGDSVPRTSTPVAGRAVSLKKMRNSRSTSHSSVSSDDDWTNIIDESSTNNELAEKCSDIVKKLDEVQTQLLKKPCSSILKRQSESSGSENRSSDSEADHSHLHHGSSRVTFNEPVSTSYNQNATRKTAPIPVPVSVASNMAAKSVPVAKVAGSVETMPASASVPVSADKLKQLMSSSALLEQLRASMMQSSRVDGDVASSRTSMPSEMIDTFLHSILQDALQHQDTEADEESDDDDVVQKVMSELIQLASRSEGQIPAQRLTAMHMQVSPSFGAPAANVAHSSHIRSVSRANTQIDNANTPTPSKMLRESQNKNYGGFQSRQSSKMQAYPTPSELLQKMLSQENHEKNAKGKDSFANYPTVSQLLNIKQMETPREKKVKEKEKKADEEEPIIRYTTPSLLIQRIQDRERTEEVAHQKSILDYTTPSRLIQKTQDRERTEEVAHQKSILDYTTPSRLIQKIQDKSNERLIGNSIPSMQKDSSEIFLTVAELIARIHEREAGVKTSPETIRYMTGPTGSSHYSPDLTPSHHRTSPTSFHDPMDQRPSLLLQMGLDKESLIHTARRKSSSELVHCSSSSSVSSRPSQLLEEYSRIIAEKEIMGDQTAHRDTTRKPGKRSSGEAEISSGREDSDSREQWNAILSWLSLQPKQSQERARSDLMNRPCQSQDADRKNVPTSDDTEQILLRDENVPSSPGVADTEFSKKNALQSGISVENRDGKNVSDTLNTSSSNDRYMEDQWNAILSWLSLNRSSLCDVDRAVVERDDNQPRGVLDQNGPQPRGVLDQNGPQPRGVSEQGDPRLADGDDQELKAKQIGKVKDQHADVMGSAETKDEKLSSGPEENPEFSASSYTWMQVVDGRSKEGIKDRGSTVASQTDPQGGATISQDKHSALFDGKNVKIPPPPNSSASSDGTNHKESTCSISPSDFLIESVVKLFEKARREDRRKMMMEMMEGNEYGIKDFSSHIAKDALEKNIEDKTQERLRIYRGQKAMNSKDKSSERHVKYSTDSLTASSHPSGATERSHEKLHKADKYLNRKLIAIDTGVRGRGTGKDRERGGEGVTGRGGGNVAEPGGGVTGRGRGNDERVTNAILSSSPSPLVSLLGHSGYVQMSGASLPTSRGASPSADQLLNSSRRRAAANDAHSFLVEKEMIESQLRKLQVENSTLQTENKLIKEKYNRAQTRIEYLESQLAVTRNVADTLHEEMNDELTVYKRRNRDQTERDRDGLQQKIISLTKELELVRAENTSLEKQLDGLRKTADFARSSADKSKIVDGYKMQVNALRDELQQTKEVLQRCENARQEEVDRRKDASTQIIKLTEMKALLQQELEQQGGGSVADRQVLRDERGLYEERIGRYKDTLDDLNKEKDNLNSTYKRQVADLVQDKHSTQSRVKTLEDMNASINAENESLKSSLRAMSGLPPSTHGEASTWQAQVTSLQSDLQVVKGDLERQLRTNKVLQAEIESVRTQLQAKEAALDEALGELGGLGGAWAGEDVADRRQLKIDRLNAELDQLQTTLRQKNRVLENLSSAEGEFNANLTTLKENLASANRELTEKTAQLKMQSVQLESQHEKIAVLERDLTSRDELLSQRITEALQEGKLTSVLYEPLQSPRSTQETLTQAETKSRLLEYEKISVNNDLRRAQAAMESVVSENSELVARLRETRQELLTERATVCQITAEKVEADQKSHLFAEERDGLLREKARLMSDLAKHESTTATAIQKLELDHQRAELDLEQKYHSLNTEGKKLATELGTSQRLLEAREKEIDLLRDTIDHQKNEMLTLTRQMDVLREENSLARQDLDRLTNQLTSKMKEHAATAEVTQFLTNEKAKLQMEKFQLEKETSMEKGELERKHHQVHDLLAKMEKSEDKLRQTEKSLHQRETQLVGLETELRHVNKNVAMLESERAQLKVQVDKLNDELRGLTSMNSTLEQRLSMEKSTLGHEKTERSQLREELGLATRQMEIIKREYDIMNASLEAERKNAHALKEQCHLEEDKTFQLENRVKTQELEIETLKSHLVENRNTIDQYKKDKQTLYQDVQDLCRKLADKDELIARLQEKCNDTVETIQKEYLSDKTAISREKDDLENSLRKARDEIDDIKEHLRHKELQLEAYVRTHRELEQETKARETAESRVEKYETEMLDSKKTLSGLHAENVRLLDANKHIKENIEKAEQQISSLREQLKSQREEFTREIHVLKHTMSEETHRHMAERSQLQEQLSKSSAELKAAEASLHSLTEAKDSLHGTNKTHERTLDTLKTQLHEEVTARKLAEHRADNLQAELHGVKARRNNLDERVTDLQTQLSKTETELALEKDKYKRLKSDLSDSQNHSTTYEAQANTLQIQVTELQAEVSSVRGQLDTLKQTSSAKNKKLLLELQQQLETFETERSKLLMQAQQLSVDLEQAREQVALKNRDNLSLQEQLLSLDATSREVSASLKQSQNAFHLEEEAREKLETRNHFLELENSRLRTHGDGESDPMMDVTRLEVNKMMSELTRQMQHQLEDQKEKDRLNRAKELKQAEESKKRVASLESSLSQEQSLHIITKTQLASVEDDNQRLRQQLQQARRKQHHSGEDRSKSRLEEINEIIARSQTRAHQLLATQGVYSPEDPLKTLSPSRDYLSSNPTMPLFLNTSPMSPQRSDGNRSLLSDDIHINGSPDSGRLLQTAPK